MTKEALLNAAQVLRSLKFDVRDRFQMSTYGVRIADGGGHPCGTAACAAGWLLIEGALPGWHHEWIPSRVFPEDRTFDALVAVRWDGVRDFSLADVANQTLGLRHSDSDAVPKPASWDDEETQIWFQYHLSRDQVADRLEEFASRRD